VARAAVANLSAFCQGQRVLDIDAKITDGILDLRVAEQDLHRPKVAWCANAFINRLRGTCQCSGTASQTRWSVALQRATCSSIGDTGVGRKLPLIAGFGTWVWVRSRVPLCFATALGG
jgi:hypothetical protein